MDTTQNSPRVLFMCTFYCRFSFWRDSQRLQAQKQQNTLFSQRFAFDARSYQLPLPLSSNDAPDSYTQSDGDRDTVLSWLFFALGWCVSRIKLSIWRFLVAKM
jgi:hypothetical protein